jgi:DnaA family protein
MRQLPLPLTGEPEPSFESFVAAPGNAAALAHLREGPACSAPLYLWGPPASGKTHLLRAAARHQHARGRLLGWFAPGDPLPWPLVPSWAAVVIDGCERLSEPEQHAAFTLFVEAQGEGVALWSAGRLPPVDLPLREDLRTRLAWGHVYAVEPLADEATRAALRQEADRRGLFLSDEVMAFLLERLPRDLGHLMRTVERLDATTLARRRTLSLPLLRELLAEGELGDARALEAAR